MFSLNRVHIIGYQTQPVNIRQTPNGTSVTDLNLVAPYSFKSESGEQLEGKSFSAITVWGSMAEVAGKYVRAGSHLFIAGRLQTDSWQDEKTNEKRSKTKIVALEMILLDPKDGQMPPLSGAKSVNAALNRADIIGHVTRDPEMRTTTGGQQVLTLGVATNERWKDKGSSEIKERSEFHNVVVWGALAGEVAKFIKKGNRVFASGRVQTRSWEAKDGSKRTTTEIVADAVSLLGVKNTTAASAIQADATPVASSSQHEEQRGPADASDVPEIAYASEIKAEDLPF